MDVADHIEADVVDSITIESATSTPEELAAALEAGGTTAPDDDAPPADADAPSVEEKQDEPPPPAEAKAGEPPAADARSEFEKQVDALDPPLPNETPEQHTARMSRGERRILQLLSRAKSTEDELTRARDALARLQTAPADEPAPTAPAAVTLPKFAFPTWDDYSEKNPEATHEDYLDARYDAKRAHEKEGDRLQAEAAATARDATQRRAALETLDRDKLSRVEAYRLATPEYDAAMSAAADLPLPPAMHVAMASSEIGPKIAHYLALHREEHLRLAALSPAGQIKAIGKLEAKLEGDTPVTSTPPAAAEPVPAPDKAAIPAPAPGASTTTRVAAPSRPSSSAPAPVSEISGSAQPTKSLQALAAQDEDADAYIVERQRQRREMGLGR